MFSAGVNLRDLRNAYPFVQAASENVNTLIVESTLLAAPLHKLRKCFTCKASAQLAQRTIGRVAW
jgi:hypothetical protein